MNAAFQYLVFKALLLLLGNIIDPGGHQAVVRVTTMQTARELDRLCKLHPNLRPYDRVEG